MNSSFLSELMQSISSRGRSLMGVKTDLPGVEPLIEQCERIVSWRGEASGMALAQSIFDCFARLTPDQQEQFFVALATKFSVDHEALGQAIAQWKKNPGSATAQSIHTISRPLSEELLSRLNRAPEGTGQLVSMREALLNALDNRPELKSTDRDFKRLFASWFNIGFLELKKIDWRTPANILEKLIQYEAVHEITDWVDLRRRIDPVDRHCYAFFHPALIDEPLIFVEVALTRQIPSAIGPILADPEEGFVNGEETTEKQDTAVFYSISNCQKGLRGVSFGHFLIKRVVAEIARDHPNINRFCTLSPIPGFTRWLQGVSDDDSLYSIVGPVADRFFGKPAQKPPRMAPRENDATLLKQLVAHYLLQVKQGQGEPLDPVARFHLGNGARLDRINFAADDSTRAQAASLGLMVNYVYDLKEIEKNHESFVKSQTIAASSEVKKLAKFSL